MEDLILKSKKRDIIGKKVSQLRAQGELPVVLYGKEIKPLNLTINQKEFEKISKTAGTSTLVNLAVENEKPVKVLIQDIQFDPVKDNIIHADLYQVKMTEKLQTEIPLKFIGESLAVKDLQGNLITNREALEVECLPDDLVSEIEVDITKLATFDDMIHVKDILVPEKISVLTDPEEVVALVEAPKTEEELEAELAPTAAEEEKAAIEGIEAQAAAEAAEKTAAEGEEKAEEGVAPEATPEQKPAEEPAK